MQSQINRRGVRVIVHVTKKKSMNEEIYRADDMLVLIIWLLYELVGANLFNLFNLFWMTIYSVRAWNFIR